MGVKSGVGEDAVSGIGERIKEAADRAGVELKTLAATVDMSERNFLRYTGGQVVPRADIVARIANATGATVDWLINGEGEPPTAEEARGALMEVASIAHRALGRVSPATEDDGLSEHAPETIREALKQSVEDGHGTTSGSD